MPSKTDKIDELFDVIVSDNLKKAKKTKANKDTYKNDFVVDYTVEKVRPVNRSANYNPCYFMEY